MFSTSSVQSRTPINREQALSGFDAVELRAHFFRRNDDGSSPALRDESALTFPAFSRRNWSGLMSAATSENDRYPRLCRNAIQGNLPRVFYGELQPTQPWRRAVGESGLRLIIAEGEHTRPRV
jgi:hypothetical protein